MRKLFLLIICVALTTLSVRAQDSTHTGLTNTLTAYLMGGYVRNTSTFDTPIEGINKNGADFGLRILCKPGHLLSGGIEVGRSHIYSVDQEVNYQGETSQLVTSMYVVPILFVFSMTPIDNISINFGTGTSLIQSEVTSFGNTVNSSTLSPMFIASANYMKPLSEDFSVGAEGKFAYMGKFYDSNVSVLLMLSYRFFTW
jgi:hypothetical protein